LVTYKNNKDGDFMRKFKTLVVAFVVLASILLLSSCSLFNRNNETFWEYSADGQTEIRDIFKPFYGANDNAAYTWNITINRSGTITSYDFDYSSYRTETVSNEKFTYKIGSKQMTKLILNEVDYYINDSEEIIYTEYDESFDKMNNHLLYVHDYGVIHLEKMNWNFVKKTENVTTTKSDGKSTKALEYSYMSSNKENPNTSTNMFISFPTKTKQPAILRLFYEVYKDNALYETITVYYKPIADAEISQADFAIPTFVTKDV
jgi:hypothetical protein